MIPVLVEGAPHPSGDDLPGDLKDLARRQSWVLTGRTYKQDVHKLAEELLAARRKENAKRAQAAKEQRKREKQAGRDRRPPSEPPEGAPAESAPSWRSRLDFSNISRSITECTKTLLLWVMPGRHRQAETDELGPSARIQPDSTKIVRRISERMMTVLPWVIAVLLILIGLSLVIVTRGLILLLVPLVCRAVSRYRRRS